MKNLPNKKFLFLLILGIVVLAPAFALADTAQDIFVQAQAAADSGDAVKALELYEQTLQADPDFAPAYNALALFYLQNNAEKVDDIIWLLEQAAQIEPQNGEPYMTMCRAYFQFQKPDLAEQACLTALSLDPNLGAARLTLAWVYLMGKEEPAKAIPYFEQIIEKVQNSKIYLGLGMAYARNNQKEKVLDIVTILRGRGDETTASQLEKLIRPSGEISVYQEKYLPPIEAGPSGIVAAQPKPEEPEGPPPVLGPKVQLKGKLTFNPPVGSSAQGYGAVETSTDVDVEDPDLGEHSQGLSIEERMEKIRNMRGGSYSSGSAQGQMNIQGGTGTGTVQLIPPPGQ